jgi:hypothetical protein
MQVTNWFIADPDHKGWYQVRNDIVKAQLYRYWAGDGTWSNALTEKDFKSLSPSTEIITCYLNYRVEWRGVPDAPRHTYAFDVDITGSFEIEARDIDEAKAMIQGWLTNVEGFNTGKGFEVSLYGDTDMAVLESVDGIRQ